MFILFWHIRILAANRWHTQVIESNLIEETVYKGVGKIKGANSGWVKHPETGHRGTVTTPRSGVHSERTWWELCVVVPGDVPQNGRLTQKNETTAVPCKAQREPSNKCPNLSAILSSSLQLLLPIGQTEQKFRRQGNRIQTRLPVKHRAERKMDLGEMDRETQEISVLECLVELACKIPL